MLAPRSPPGGAAVIDMQKRRGRPRGRIQQHEADITDEHAPNIEAALWSDELNQPLNIGRDMTILRWLTTGNVRALAAMLLQGHQPGSAVLIYLGKMLLEADDVTFTVPSRGTYPVPYRLVAKKRTRTKGRKRDPENDIRDLLIARNVARLSKDGGYEAAVARMVEVSKETGANIERATIRKAYGRFSRKK